MVVVLLMIWQFLLVTVFLVCTVVAGELARASSLDELYGLLAGCP